MTDTQGLLREVGEFIRRGRSHSPYCFDAGCNCEWSRLAERIDAALAQQAPAEQAGWKLVDERHLWAAKVAGLHQAIERALQYDLQKVMRRADIRLLTRAVGRPDSDVDGKIKKLWTVWRENT